MPIFLTPAAADRVKTYLSESNDGLGLRIGVKTVGCSGLAYVVDLADSIDTEDQVFESNGVKVVVDAKSLPFIDGTEIDFSNDGLGESFKYNNPNVKSECGCGESFGV